MQTTDILENNIWPVDSSFSSDSCCWCSH